MGLPPGATTRLSGTLVRGSASISILSQSQQLYRSLRDGLRHRRLRCRPENLQLIPELVSVCDSRDAALWAAAGTAGLRNESLRASLVVQSHPAFCGLAAAATVLKSFQSAVPSTSPLSEMNASGVETTSPQAGGEKQDAAAAAYKMTRAWLLAGGEVDIRELGLEDRAVLRCLDPPRSFPSVWYAHWGFGLVDVAFPAAVKRRLLSVLQYDGLPIDIVDLLINMHGLVCQRVFPETFSDFESLLANALADKNGSTVVVNFGRGALGQRGTGHYAPVAALSPDGMALVLDTNAWRYPSAWVPLRLLWEALNVSTPNGKRRGCLHVSVTGKAAHAA